MENENVKFEEAIERLEAIVSYLESGKCELDESMKLFEEGISLVKVCTAKLDEATSKVKILTAGGEADFETGEV